MNEAAARQAVLLQAFETAEAEGPLWTAQDRDWATRLAREAMGPQAGADAFVAARTHGAMQRLLPRLADRQRWLGLRLWHARWLPLAVAGGLVLGLAANAIGPSQRINLLAPPVWAVLLWNGVVYGLLLAHALAALLGRVPRRPGPLRQLVQRLPPFRLALPVAAGAGAAAARDFRTRWLTLSLPLTASRAALLMHAGAAALALGLIGGLYLRGLVRDYRAGGESTFLGAATVHRLLTALLAPAAAWAGIALPDEAGIEALRVTAAGGTGGPAADWIHLYALTLLAAVVLPRAALALGSGLRAAWLARRFALPLADPYFQRLLREQQGRAALVSVQPYAQAPDAAAALGLRAVLARVYGESVQLGIAPALAFGDDEALAAAPPLPAGSTVVVALFDLAATPEAEHHGRFLQALARAGMPVLAVVDEAAFRARFGGLPERLAERRAAWQRLAGNAVFVDLSQPDLAAAERAVQIALAAA